MSERVGFRCPDDIAIAINRIAEEEGKEKTAVIIDLLRLALDMPENDQIANIERRLRNLEERMNNAAATASVGKRLK